MLFASTIFICGFLPIILIGYYLIDKKYQNYFLLFFSLLFYAWGEPKFIIVMLCLIIANYTFGILIDKYRKNKSLSKTFLVLCLITDLGVFFVFKYLNFTVSNIDRIFGDILPQTNILLPIGISFFTFKAMSYVVDVYRKISKVQKNPFYLGLYVSFFPYMIAGPIVRYNTIEEQINNRNVTLDSFSYGVKRFIMGLGKKVLIADTLAIVADKAFEITELGQLSVSFAWLGAIAYSFQIFFDFSGYSDMAIGLGKMLGFNFMENFNFPYIAKTIKDFWKRWHMSLTTWFREYLYFPLGGSRVKTKSRLVFNLFIVWLLTGVWHGASWNFIFWGLFYFVLLVFEKLVLHPETLGRKTAIFYQVCTMFFVLIDWVFFRAVGLKNAIKYLMSMFGVAGNQLIDNLTILYINENWVFFIFAILLSAPIVAKLKEKIQKRDILLKSANALSVVFYIALFILSMSYLVVGKHNPFIYFNF